MNQPTFPVTMLVRAADGSTQTVRIGTAVREGEAFRVSLGELTIGSTPDRASMSGAPAPQARSGGRASGADGMVFPPYGRSKGAPIAGASVQDLEYYIQGSRRSLDDPSKARFHDKERVLLAAMEAELARQKGGAPARAGRPAPGPSDGDPGPEAYDEPPPFDDDVPF